MAENGGTNELEESRLKLRQRWELASVLNFLTVFEPVVAKDLKMSAEEIENGLISPNASLAKLHVTLLKGIPPVNKNLSNPDVWVTILCRKLSDWWPWVAEGEIPLTVAKGEEISRYKELDPVIRLMMLKALCEVRTEQDDLVSYINDALKEGKELSHFRKDKIGEDGTGTSYWYDGNSVIGHRLYREVAKIQVKPRQNGRGCLDRPLNVKWETLATNLGEFREVMEQLSSAKKGVESKVYKFIETEAVPVLEQLEKKKERALKRQQRQEALLNNYQPYAAGVTRSCRTRRPVSYTFADFDRTIDEAIKQTRKRKDRKEERYDAKRNERGKRDNGASDGDSAKAAHSDEGSLSSMNEDVEHEQGEDIKDDEEDNYSERSDKNKDGKSDVSESSDDSDLDNGKAGSDNHVKLHSDEENDHDAAGLHTKNSPGRASGRHLQETRNLGAKNRMRQRPTRNTAIDSVVPDSDDGSSSENQSSNGPGMGDPSVVSDSEDEIGS